MYVSNLFSVLLLLISFRFAQFRSTGPPGSACSDMTPQHGVSPMNTSALNVITITNGETMYQPNKSITVEIAGNKFEGFMLQARKEDGGSTIPVGTFSNLPKITKTMKCSADDDTFVHTDKSLKTSVTVTWNPPAGSAGEIKFRLTVVAEKTKFWVGILSSKLSPVPWYPSAVPTTTEAKGCESSRVYAGLLMALATIVIVLNH